MHGRGLLIIFVCFLSISAWSQDEFDSDDSDLGTSQTVDEFSEFEDTPEPAPEASTSESAKKSAAKKAAENPPANEDLSLDDFPEETPEEPPPVAEPTPTPPEETPVPDEPPSLAEPEPVAPAPVVAQPEVPAVAEDEPDFRAEESFHQIYRKYNRTPTSNDSWAKAIVQSQVQIYEVQSHDTLWDISKTLFGDSFFWPKIWALNNDSVLNPHEISPDMKVKFFPGSLTEAPSLAMAPEETPLQQALAKNETEAVAAATDGDPTMPAPFRKSKKLRVVPDSLPLYRFEAVNRPEPKVEMELHNRNSESPLVYVSNYIIEGEQTYVGEIFETELGMASAAEFQYIVVKLDDPGTTIFHAVEEVESLGGDGRPTAKILELQGEIEVLEKVAEGDNLYRAIVGKNIAAIKVGAKLLPGKLPRANIKNTDVNVEVPATIVGGQYSRNRKLYSAGDFVYLDAGSAVGLKAGMSAHIFANLKSRNDKTSVQNLVRKVGTLKIMKVTDNYSTAYITEASEDIAFGDRVGANSSTLPIGPIEHTAVDTGGEKPLDLEDEDSAEKNELDIDEPAAVDPESESQESASEFDQ